MNSYQVIIRNSDNTYMKYLNNFHSLKYGRADRSIYSCEIKIPSNILDYSDLYPDLLIEIYRYNDYDDFGLDGQTVFFLRTWSLEIDNEGREILTIVGFDSLYVLTSRINAYPASDSKASLSYPARQALTQVVYNNMRGGAITERQISTSYFITETAVTTGATITKDCAWQELKSLLDEIVNQSRDKGSWITYDVVYNGKFPLVFTTFAEQRGNDLTSKIELSPESKNVSEPKLIFDYSGEITASYLLAGGEGSARIVGRADSSRVAVNPFSRREGKKENTQISVQASADNEAQELLDKYKGKVYFSGKIIQTKTMRYGIDWNYGDKIRASWKGLNFDCRVLSYEINYSNTGNLVDEVNAFVVGETWL